MEGILTMLGEFGLYQKRVYLLLCISIFYAGLYETMSLILLYSPDHRCKMPEFDNDTYEIQSVYHQNLTEIYIPLYLTGDEREYDQCHIYSFEDVMPRNFTTAQNASRVKCDEWVYKRTLFTETFTVKFNLVCSYGHLIPLLKALFITGKLAGAFVFGFVADKYGRKRSHCAALVIMFGLTFGMSWSSSYIMLAIFMCIIGATTQGIFPIGFVLGVELVAPSKRKYACLFFQYFFTLGLVVLPGVSYFIRDSFFINIVCSAPAVLFLTYLWLLPESPRWLISKHRYQEAKIILERIAKVNKKVITEVALNNLEIKNVTKSGGKLWHLFTTRILLMRTLTILFNWSLISITYYGATLNANNLGGNFYLNLFLTGLVEFPAHAMVSFLIDRVGRKKTYCFCMILGGCVCGITTIPIMLNENDHRVVIIVLAMVGKLLISGAYNTIYLFSSELFPTVVRTKAMAACVCTGRVGGIAAPFIADASSFIGGDIAKVLPFGVFGILSTVAGLSSMLLPETLKKPLPETIDDLKMFRKCHHNGALNDKTYKNSQDTLKQKKQKHFEKTDPALGTEITKY